MFRYSCGIQVYLLINGIVVIINGIVDTITSRHITHWSHQETSRSTNLPLGFLFIKLIAD